MVVIVKFQRMMIYCKGLDNVPGFLLLGIGVYLFVLLTPQLVVAQASKPNLMLLSTYHENQDLTGWVMSEKYDGVRAYWDGKNLISRQGNVFNAPDWFIQNFPTFELDGELWLARGQFSETVSIVRRQTPDIRWQSIRYLVFEVPNQKGDLLERMSILSDYLKTNPNFYINPVEQIKIESNNRLSRELKRVLDLGGEGLVVRNPNLPYKTGRLKHALKIKQKQDAECIVQGYTKGAGKYKGQVGALICKLIPEQLVRLFPKLSTTEHQLIKIGSGLSDHQRKHPPSVGSIITFQHMGLTKSGLPRFPVFLRERM